MLSIFKHGNTPGAIGQKFGSTGGALGKICHDNVDPRNASTGMPPMSQSATGVAPIR